MKKSNLELAKEISEAVLADFGQRAGVLDGIDEETMADIQDDLDGLVFEKLETNDLDN